MDHHDHNSRAVAEPTSATRFRRYRRAARRDIARDHRPQGRTYSTSTSIPCASSRGRRGAHARVRRLDPRSDAARRARARRSRSTPRTRATSKRPSIGMVLSSRTVTTVSGRDAGTNPERRALHLQGPVPRPGLYWYHPTHPGGLRRSSPSSPRSSSSPRTLLLAPVDRHSPSPWTTSSSRTERWRVSAARSRPSRLWARNVMFINGKGRPRGRPPWAKSYASMSWTLRTQHLQGRSQGARGEAGRWRQWSCEARLR